MMGEDVLSHKVQPQYALRTEKALRRIEKEIDVCREHIAYYEKRLFDYHENDLNCNYEDTLRRYENLRAERLAGSGGAASGGWKIRRFLSFCMSIMRGVAAAGTATVLMAAIHILLLGLDFGLMGTLLLLTLGSSIGLTWMIADCILGQRRVQIEKRHADMELETIEGRMAELAREYEAIIVSNRKRVITLFRRQEALMRQTASGGHQEEPAFEGEKRSSIWNGRLV